MASLLNLKNITFTSYEEEDSPFFMESVQLLCSF